MRVGRMGRNRPVGRALQKYLPNGRFVGVPLSRTRTMQKIGNRGNKSTEWRLRATLVRSGVSGWHMHPAEVTGKPDFLFPKARLAVFVDGCYWHGCPLHASQPNTNRSFWMAKFAQNAQRDRTVTRCLRRAGFAVLRFWEHELRDDPPRCVQRIEARIRSRRNQSRK